MSPERTKNKPSTDRETFPDEHGIRALRPWKKRLKKIALSILRLGPVAWSVRRCRRPLSALLPATVVGRIPVAGRIRVALPNGKQAILFSDGRDSLATTIFWRGLNAFEPELTAGFFLRLVKPGDTVFDIGANVGLFGLMAAVSEPTCRVHAFEPHPKVFEYLERNVRGNGLDNMTPQPMAVSNRDGEVSFYVPATVTLSFSATTLEGFRRSENVITVPAVTLDRYVEDNRLEKVDLIKIDTEATEHLVLGGATEILERDRPLIVMEILGHRTEKALERIFQDRPYRSFLITNRGLVPASSFVGDPTYRFRNFLLIPQNRMALVAELILEGPSAASAAAG